jgi:hypothetical protein
VTGERAEQVALGLSIVLIASGAWWYGNRATFGDPPSEIHFESCVYRASGSFTTLPQAELVEHSPIAFRTTHFGKLGKTWAGRPFFGLEIGPGCPNNSPLDIYLQGAAAGQVELYRRDGGP